MRFRAFTTTVENASAIRRGRRISKAFERTGSHRYLASSSVVEFEASSIGDAYSRARDLVPGATAKTIVVEPIVAYE